MKRNIVRGIYPSLPIEADNLERVSVDTTITADNVGSLSIVVNGVELEGYASGNDWFYEGSFGDYIYEIYIPDESLPTNELENVRGPGGVDIPTFTSLEIYL